jgi:peptide deformylase
MYAAPGTVLPPFSGGTARDHNRPRQERRAEGTADLHQSEVIRHPTRKHLRRGLCLSEYYEEVERPKAVKVKFLDLDLKPQEIEAEGLLATCLQHEIDHINGVLFIDHISKLKRDMVMKKFKKAAKKTEGGKPLSEDQEPSHHIG